jgi:hypothetical protein
MIATIGTEPPNLRINSETTSASSRLPIHLPALQTRVSDGSRAARLPHLFPAPDGDSNSFKYFTQLPPELQQEIWDVAASMEPDGGPRIQRIAPTTPLFARQVDKCKKVGFSIINRPHAVPSVLRVN